MIGLINFGATERKILRGEDLRLKTCGFLLFNLSFLSIVVSSLVVRLYDYRSSADDFPTKLT